MSRVLLVLLALGVFAVSCSGNSSQLAADGPGGPAVPGDTQSGTTEPVTTAGLGSLPSPRGVSEDGQVLSLQPGTRSYITSTAACALFTGQGVSQPSPDFFLQLEPLGPEMMAYTFFMIDSQEDPAIDLVNISLNINWLDGMPEDESEGIFVGVPDFEADTWIWAGPARTSADLLDFSGKGLGTDPGNFDFIRVALVNYSGSTAQLQQFNFTTDDPADTAGDAAYFYVTDDGTGSAVRRVTQEGLGEPETIVSEGPGYTYRHLYLLEAEGGDPLLVFDRLAPGGPWEIWQANLDGSGLMLRHGGAGDVCTAGFTPEGAAEFVIDRSQGKLTKLSTGDNSLIYEDVVPEEFNGAVQWMPTKWYEVSLVATGTDSEGVQSLMYLLIHPSMDFYSYRTLTYSRMNDVVETSDPCLVRWADGLFGYSDMAFYSARYAGGATMNIHSWLQSHAVSSNNMPYIVDERYDLRYPVVSPDNRLISLVACEPGADKGMLIMQSAFQQSLGNTVIDGNVSSAGVWFDPTPVPEPTWD